MRSRLIGLVAALALVAIVAGLPVALLAAGSPLPETMPSGEDVRSALMTPDDGRLALSAITLVGWVCWVLLTFSVVLEVGARVRVIRQVPTLPGLAVPQSMARGLVSGALLLVVSGPVAASAATVLPVEVAAAASENVPVEAGTSTATPGQGSEQKAPRDGQERPDADGEASDTRAVVVEPGDSLWALAETHLGDGREFTQILDANRAVLGDNGSMLTPGTVLQIPQEQPIPGTNTDARTTMPAGAEPVTVVKGDTLSQIAEEELGSAQRYPQIVRANADEISDPDHIEPGWVLDMPDATGASSSAPPRHEDPERAPEHGNGGASNDPQATTQESTSRVETGRGAAAGAATGTAAPSPTRSDSAPTQRDAPTQPATAGAEEEQSEGAPWMTAGIVGAGALLAGGLYGMRRLSRRRAMRGRRPGRTLVAPSQELAGLERTIRQVGAQSAVTIEWMDEALRRLAASLSPGPLPQMVAVELTDEGATLFLGEPMAAPHPWSASEDRMRWTLPAGTTPAVAEHAASDLPAPWPLLATIGRDGHGRPWWLLNLEEMALTVTGDLERGTAFARYVAAEIAVNPWSQNAWVHLIGLGEELADLAPERLVAHAGNDEDPAGRILLEAIECADLADGLGQDVAALRASGAEEGAWTAQAVVADGSVQTPALDQLEGTVRSAAGRTGTGVIMVGGEPGDGLVVEVDTHGRVRLPHAGLELEGVGLTAEEARACAQLARECRRTDEAPIPAVEDPERAWEAWSDSAGALREEYTSDRHAAADSDSITMSVLEDDDEEYLQAGATTAEDLTRLAPRVDGQVGARIEEDDPTLDADLALWWSQQCDLPRLTLLGPVTVRTVGGKAMTERLGLWTEAVAYLALHPKGVTGGQAGTDFNVSPARVRSVMKQTRDWLGDNPRTGGKHLPDARKGPRAQVTGVPVYELVDVLVDFDLFRRLRVRGQARGEAGVEDLLAALRLVQGRPFDQLRLWGWGWLSTGESFDQYADHAIADTAHVVTTACLRAGDLRTARLATETACMAVPHDQIKDMDLARISEAEGDVAEAERIVRDEICNATDDDGAPLDLSERTQQVLTEKGWTGPHRRAS